MITGLLIRVLTLVLVLFLAFCRGDPAGSMQVYLFLPNATSHSIMLLLSNHEHFPHVCSAVTYLFVVCGRRYLHTIIGQSKAFGEGQSSLHGIMVQLFSIAVPQLLCQIFVRSVRWFHTLFHTGSTTVCCSSRQPQPNEGSVLLPRVRVFRRN